LTVIDHPARQTFELNRRIKAEFGDHACWGAGLIFDSMLTLEFGGKHTLIGKRGPITIGDFRVLLDDVFWLAERDGKVVLTSEQPGAEDINALNAVFVGHRLLRMEWGVYCSLIFSDDLVLRCDLTDEYENGCEQIFEFRFPNGDCVDCFVDGVIETERPRE